MEDPLRLAGSPRDEGRRVLSNQALDQSRQLPVGRSFWIPDERSRARSGGSAGRASANTRRRREDGDVRGARLSERPRGVLDQRWLLERRRHLYVSAPLI